MGGSQIRSDTREVSEADTIDQKVEGGYALKHQQAFERL
jgi:hypothetical protein